MKIKVIQFAILASCASLSYAGLNGWTSANGYIESDDDLADYLLKLPLNVKIDKSREKDDFYTGLKIKKDAVKLTFKFDDIDNNGIKIIGYAAGGSFKKGQGWTQINIFFYNKDLGTCTFNINDIKSANATDQLSQESVQYIINNNPTTITQIGSEKTGFLYSISWYHVNEQMGYRMECATKNYDQNEMNKLINNAKLIDQHVNAYPYSR